MKTRKKLAITALSTVLLGSFVAGTTMMAFANSATDGSEYDAKYDQTWYNFETAGNTTGLTAGNGASLGEKPYLHVEYTVGASVTPGDAIYKHGSSELNMLAQAGEGAIVNIRMRAPEGDVKPEDLIFAVRSPNFNEDTKVVAKTFAELNDSNSQATFNDTYISTDWETYEISLSTSYEEDDKYDGTASVTDALLAAFHIYAANDTAAGVIDIDSITFGADNDVLADFSGSTDIEKSATALNPNKDGWTWAGSAEGGIIARETKLGETGGTLEIVQGKVGDTLAAYKDALYAVIVAEGDGLSTLKVSTTTDGTTWTEATDFDADTMSLAVTEDVTGFKFESEGEVILKSIYLTNLFRGTPATAVPVIDASTADLLEDFSFAGSGFKGYDDTANSKPAGWEAAGIDIRLSYDGSSFISVADGNLVLDNGASENALMSYEFSMLNKAKGKYIVFKMKAEDGANLNDFRFRLGGALGSYGPVVYANQLMAGVAYNSPLLTEANPYKTADGYYYVVADIEQSGLGVSADGYSAMLIYNNGTAGKLLIDSIFFADEVPQVANSSYTVQNEAGDGDFVLDFKAESEGYQYGCAVTGLNDLSGAYNTLAMDITVGADTDLSGVRFAFDCGERWGGGEGRPGYLVTTDGTNLADVAFEAGVKKTVYIDLDKSDITISNFHIHTNGTGTGNFKIENAKLVEYVRASEIKTPDVENAFVVKDENDDTQPFVLDFKATGEGYQYGCEVKGLDDLEETYDLLAMDITVGEDTDLSGVRFAISGAEYWGGGEGHTGYLVLADGTYLADAGFEAGVKKTVYVDLAKSGITMSSFHIHTNGTGTGDFKLENVLLAKYAPAPSVLEGYKAAMDNLPKYLDNVAPELSITVPETAKAGDEITIEYTATDDITAAADLDVKIEVTKDGEPVAITGNKFTAEAGTYHVTVTVTDENGNKTVKDGQIVVSAKKKGCKSDAFSAGGGVIGLAAVAGVLAITVAIRKKKEN